MKSFIFVLLAITLYLAANGSLIRLWDDLTSPLARGGGGGGTSSFG